MLEILECGRTIAGGYVAFDIQWTGDLGAAGTVLWSMEVRSEDGSETVLLGHQRSGDESLQFVDDATTGRRVDVEPDADVGRAEITVRFPADVVGVAVEWPVWRGVIAVDGETVSHCVASV